MKRPLFPFSKLPIHSFFIFDLRFFLVGLPAYCVLPVHSAHLHLLCVAGKSFFTSRLCLVRFNSALFCFSSSFCFALLSSALLCSSLLSCSVHSFCFIRFNPLVPFHSTRSFVLAYHLPIVWKWHKSSHHSLNPSFLFFSFFFILYYSLFFLLLAF